MKISFPVIPGLHKFLYKEWAARTYAWHSFWRVVYYEPMFKAMCKKVGPGLKIEYAGNGIPRIIGGLHIYFGRDIYTFDNIYLCGVGYADKPELHVGNHCYLAPQIRIMVGTHVTIGDYTLIGNRVMIMDNSGKPLDPADRLIPGGGRSPLSTFRPVTIGAHCLIGVDCFVMPGTTVRDGVFAKPGTQLRGYVPPFALIEGNPWRIVKMLPITKAMRAIAGDEQYNAWIVEQREYCENNGIPMSDHGNET
jgi:acetyltransferase-like isoleucine patch superfamily enzyme